MKLMFKGGGIGVGAGATDWSGWNIEEDWLVENKISGVFNPHAQRHEP